MSGLPQGWEGRGPEEWARVLGLAGLELHEVLPSTNDRARALLREGAGAFTAVVAARQTHGRGREGRPWHSPAGAGLWISFVLGRPAAAAPGLASLAVGAAAADALEEAAGLGPCGIGVKWPNDLVVGGQKVAGILCEAEDGPGEAGLVAGIGVNLRRPRGSVPAGMENAGFLEEVAGRRVKAPALAGALAAGLRRWAEPLPGRLEGDLREALARRDALRGRTVVVGGGVLGRADGIEADGRLRVVDAHGTVHRLAGGGVQVEGERQAR